MRKMKTSRCILLLLLPILQVKGQDDYSSCMSLQNSLACSAYSQFYISVLGSIQRYPFLANVTDVASLDQQLQLYVNSDDFYLQPFGCNTNIPNYARYSLTYMCASIIQDNRYSLPCNYQYNLNPPPLCQSTCYDWTNSIDAITSNTNVCSDQQQQQAQVASLNSTCQMWIGLNGTSNCISGAANEPNFCGFSNQKEACSYCSANSSDNCCQTIRCSTKLSAGAIAGIVIGLLLLIGMIAAFVWFYKKKKNNGISYTKNGFSLNQKVEQQQQQQQQHDSTLMLGYDSSFNVAPTSIPPAVVTTNQPLLSNSTTNGSPLMEEFFQVKHPYPPQMGDELGLHVGDIVCSAMNFDDGWALGFNVTTGNKGVFPVVCVTPANEELLEQLLYSQDQPTNKTLVEDNMQQICENLRRSMSLSSNSTKMTHNFELTQHSNIPRRTASMMRHPHSYESDSPISPTTQTPFFSDSLSQPEPALFHQPESFEMYRQQQKNNRVSKLEQPE